jgi:hypothetical protein
MTSIQEMRRALHGRVWGAAALACLLTAASAAWAARANNVGWPEMPGEIRLERLDFEVGPPPSFWNPTSILQRGARPLRSLAPRAKLDEAIRGEMKRSRFSEEEIIGILKEVEESERIRDVWARHNIREQTFFRWRRKLGGLESSLYSLCPICSSSTERGAR